VLDVHAGTRRFGNRIGVLGQSLEMKAIASFMRATHSLRLSPVAAQPGRSGDHAD
jgi:hypothetical protein